MECSVTCCGGFYVPNVRAYFYIALYARWYQTTGQKTLLCGAPSPITTQKGSLLGSKIPRGLNSHSPYFS